jgi:hypothetical protein
MRRSDTKKKLEKWVPIDGYQDIKGPQITILGKTTASKVNANATRAAIPIIGKYSDHDCATNMTVA